MEAEREIIHGDNQEVKAPRMNRRQWKAARGNREDKWTRKRRLGMEATLSNMKKYQDELMELGRTTGLEDEDEGIIFATRYRDDWIKAHTGFPGSYEDTTSIPPMLYTDEPVQRFNVGCSSALLIFSVKLTRLHKDLKWPLDVYGIVAARDSLDRKRNLIFNRSRDNCQTLTTEDDAALLLTGPSRAIVIISPVHFEVELRVKGETPEHEDKLLSLQHIDDNCICVFEGTRFFCHEYSSKLCTVELTVGRLELAVEATISVRVVEGSWPAQYHGWFAARVDSFCNREMVLLDSRQGPTVPIAGDDVIELSRRVLSVEVDGELTFCVDVWQGDDKCAKDEITFTPKRAGRSKGICNIGFCTLEVTIAWSCVRSW